MSKRRKKSRARGGQGLQETAKGGAPLAFSFGDPEPVLSGRELVTSLGVELIDNGKYYEPPVPLTGLAGLRRANAYHGPLLSFKVNAMMRGFTPSAALARVEMKKAAVDYMTFANAYFQKIFNRFGEVVALRHLPAINMRRHKDPDRYCLLGSRGQIISFEPGEVLQIKNYDVEQSIYGVPDYLGAIQSMLLNEDSTLFRRRYYRNGAHMGYVFYSSGSMLSEDDQQALKKAVEGSKGVGNFKNMFLHIPNGREKDIQILPVGDFSTRDELEKIKNLSRDDIIAAHRVPPGLANIIPQNTAGFGDIVKINRIYYENEIEPLREDFLAVNDELPEALRVSFAEPENSPLNEEENTVNNSQRPWG